MHRIRDSYGGNHVESQHLAAAKATLTKVGDPDGDALIEHVENHDDDKADDGGRD